MVTVPVVCLVLLWAVVLTAALSGSLPGRGFTLKSHRDVVELALFAGASLVIIASAVVMGRFARRLSRDISGLEATAQHLAEEQLPQLVARLRRGEQPAPAAGESLPRAHTKTAEIARAAEAIASLQHAAVAAAAGEASLRGGIGGVFVSLARRNQSLLQRQLRLIDALEQKASDPAALADLFPLDHLTTRMRRHAEGLIILSGAAPGRSWSEPVPVIDVVRGAVAEVEDYKRVRVLTRAEDAVAGSAVADMIHLLAELIENATLFSPSGTPVEVRAERVANGFAIEIDDRGLGIQPDQMDAINQQLASPPDFDLANADRLGLFVVGKLAVRHGVRVSLRPSPYGGTTAIVLMPHSIVVQTADPGADRRSAAQLAIGRSAGPGLRAGEALALTGQRPAAPSLPPGVAGEPAAASEGLPPAGAAAAGTYRGLPRRVRQASLSPHLRDSPPAASRPADTDPSLAPPADRTPEQARDLVSSLQSGWQRGRQADGADERPAAGPPEAGEQDSDAPQNEEE